LSGSAILLSRKRDAKYISKYFFFKNETLATMTKQGYSGCFDLGSSLDASQVGIHLILLINRNEKSYRARIQ
jgi:hypothetical protein